RRGFRVVHARGPDVWLCGPSIHLLGGPSIRARAVRPRVLCVCLFCPILVPDPWVVIHARRDGVGEEVRRGFRGPLRLAPDIRSVVLRSVLVAAQGDALAPLRTGELL